MKLVVAVLISLFGLISGFQVSEVRGGNLSSLSDGEWINSGVSGRGSPAVQEHRAETLLQWEEEVARDQQLALERVAAQQATLRTRQTLLEQKEEALSRDVMAMLQAGEHDSILVRMAKLLAQPLRYVPKPYQIFGFMGYMALMVACGYVYGVSFTYAYPLLSKPPGVSPDAFAFGLFRCRPCDPDWRLCCCSFFCLPVRWSDTVSSSKVGFIRFWPALMLFAFLQALSWMSGFAVLILLYVCVRGRQRIRSAYGLPHGTLSTCCADTCIWCWCAPCATMQEASQVEFVEIPMAPGEETRPSQHTWPETADV